jgi:hypothetical protein
MEVSPRLGMMKGITWLRQVHLQPVAHLLNLTCRMTERRIRLG